MNYQNYRSGTVDRLFHRQWKRLQLWKLLGLVTFVITFIFGCNHDERRTRDKQPSEKYLQLQSAGCSERGIQQLLDMGINDEEVSEIVTMRHAGTAEKTIVRLLKTDRLHHSQFELGNAVAELRNAGVSDKRIIDLLELNAILVWCDEIIEMRNAGMSDSAIVRLAELKFKESKSVISGRDIAAIKQTGVSEVGIINLVEHGISSAQIDKVVQMRHKGFSEDEIIDKLF